MHPGAAKIINSGNNNNKKEVTIAQFIAGAAAYQKDDRKSSPNNVQKSCRTDVTTITVLKSMEVRQIKHCSTQANFLLQFRMEFVQFLEKQCYLLPAYLRVYSGADLI